MPKLDAAYIKHCAKYHNTLSSIEWSTLKKKAKKLITMPDIRVTIAENIIALFFAICRERD